MPVGLSSSTLNLKFMQRAAARTPTTSAPSTPVPASAQAQASSSKHVKSESTPAPSEVPTPDEPSTPLIASEEPYRWKLDRPSSRHAHAHTEPALLIPKAKGVTFESSYLPFMDHGDNGSNNEAGPSRQGGGGRMTFGYTEPEQEDLEKDGEDGEEPADGNGDDDVVINVREKDKDRKQHGRSQPVSRRGGLFQRPRSRSISPQRSRHVKAEQSLPAQSRKPALHANGHAASSASSSKPTSRSALPPVPRRIDDGDSDIEVLDVKTEPTSSTSNAAGKRKDDKKNNKKKRKQSQAGMNDVQTPNSGAGPSTKGTATVVADKRPRLEPSLIHDHSQSQTPTPAISTNTSRTASPGSGGGRTLDEREQALKAQRRKEKSARKKAKKAAA